MTSPKQSSEFGGDPGLIQPEPHTPTAAEEARIQRNIEDDRVDDYDQSYARGGRRKERGE